MGETVSARVVKRERPTGLFIVVLLEAFAGVRYLLDIIAYPSFDLAWILLIALMLISFLVAYGLWRIARWAWVISFALSIFGVVSTIFLLALGGVSEALLFVSVPSILIDDLVIVILLTKEVRSQFWSKIVGRTPP